MKKLLLPLTFLCLFLSCNRVVAQQTQKKNTTNKIQRAGSKMSKNNAVVRIKEVPARRDVVSRSSNRTTKRRQRIVETGKSIKKVSHREMIAKRKRIVENY